MMCSFTLMSNMLNTHYRTDNTVCYLLLGNLLDMYLHSYPVTDNISCYIVCSLLMFRRLNNLMGTAYTSYLIKCNSIKDMQSHSLYSLIKVLICKLSTPMENLRMSRKELCISCRFCYKDMLVQGMLYNNHFGKNNSQMDMMYNYQP